MDLSREALDARIEGLRGAYTAYGSLLRERNRVYLRAYSPPFESKLAEHDQWPERIKAAEAGHTRSSYNITRAVADIWTSLEAGVFPTFRWWEQYVPTPVPTLDEEENARTQSSYRAGKLAARQLATLREQTVKRHVRMSRMARHYYRAIRRKNIYGHSWVKTWPDRSRQTFRIESDIDNSTVYPVWSAWDSSKLDAILVAYRRSARTVAAQYPGSVKLERDGMSAEGSSYYVPTSGPAVDIDRQYVWVEDYWCLDETLDQDGAVSASKVANAVRVNGKIVSHEIYDDWRAIPYVYFENADERDHYGFSDVGTVLSIQDGLNRMLSQQQDVIFGESRPRFKYRGDADRHIDLTTEEVVSLDMDEDIDQIRVSLDVFPTQVHGTQLFQVLEMATGLPPAVWGRIQAAQNSGRALATAWRATAARLSPRLDRTKQSLDDWISMWLDWLELYEWDGAKTVFRGNRDFEADFPNQEPRDFTEVTLDAANKLNAGMWDIQAAMEAIGVESPDEMLERVRASYLDTVLHPEKAQSFLLLTRLQNQIEIEARQAGLQEQAAQAQLAQMTSSVPGNAPSAGPVTPEQQQGMAEQAAVEQAATAAPRLSEAQNAPAGAPGGPAGASRRYGTLVQDGKAMNRLIDQGPLS